MTSPSRAISRRRFLRGLGSAGVVAGAGGALIPLTALTRNGQAEAEKLSDAKIAEHQWVMVNDQVFWEIFTASFVKFIGISHSGAAGPSLLSTLASRYACGI